MQSTATTPGQVEALPRLLPALLFTAAILVVAWIAPPIALTGNGLNTGEFWRFLTHPWLHVSTYHALMDASAFAMVFMMLERGRLSRIATAAGGILGGAALATLDPNFSTSGLCGLSAGAHGMLAVVLSDRIRNRARSGHGVRVELVAMGILLIKSTWEALNGTAALMPFHLGNVGLPNSLSHLGGVVGAIAASVLVRPKRTH